MKLYKNMPLIEPLEYKEVKKIRDFVIAIDTSASVQGELVEHFLRKTCEILLQEMCIRDRCQAFEILSLPPTSSIIPNPDKPEKFFCISSKFQVQ